MMLSFIIVNYNTKNLLKRLLLSIKKYFKDVEIIVIDNASGDGSQAMVKSDFPSVNLIPNTENKGFAYANNQAMAIAQGDVFVLINSDAELIDNSIVSAAETVQAHQDYGLVGCRLLNSDGSVQISVGRFPGIAYAFLSNTGLGVLLPSLRRGTALAGSYFDYTHLSQVDWVMGACMILRKDVYLRVGGLNTDYFMFGEDMEWCYRIKQAGYKIVYLPDTSITHHFNKSRSSLAAERFLLMYKNYYAFCNKYLGRKRTFIIRLFNILGLTLRYAAFKSHLIRSNDVFLMYWFSNFGKALRAQFKS